MNELIWIIIGCAGFLAWGIIIGSWSERIGLVKEVKSLADKIDGSKKA